MPRVHFKGRQGDYYVMVRDTPCSIGSSSSGTWVCYCGFIALHDTFIGS